MIVRKRNNYPSWQLRHEGVLFWIFEHPAASAKECAQALNYSPSQISRIVNSPAFSEKFQAMRNRELDAIINYRILKNNL